MLYEKFIKCIHHIVKISDTINDGWKLKNHGENVYLAKTVTQVLPSTAADESEIVGSSEDLEEDNQSECMPGVNVRNWEFHILFNNSYNVPVLYFNVWKSSGQLLTLDELWQSVDKNHRNQVFCNKWFTLTQTEHPYLFRPFFYFHPCDTHNFMKCFDLEDNNSLISWLSSFGQIIWLEMNECRMNEEGASLEGFLCPDCFSNFRSAVQLSAHYQDQHSEDFFRNVKEIYEKAKKKILFKEQGNVLVEAETNIPKATPGYRPSQGNSESGPTRSHSEYFKTVRTNKMEHFAAQTNNLLIRLEKLLINLPSDRIKRKVHEQDVVPWLDDKDVKLCPGCAKPFGLLRRKHHCRLCGSVMCTECTCQLSLETARKMTWNSVGENVEHSETESGTKKTTPIKKLLKSPTSASVQSVLVLDMGNESFFRLCEHCYLLLQMRQNIKEVRNQRPIIYQFYEKLSNAMNETSPLLVKYSKMYNSLCSGETTYNLNDAEILRVKIIKLAENIDFMSNKIAILGQNTERPPEGNQLQLQKAIRIAATNFLKEHIITLPSLPTEDQIKLVQERRREEIAKKIEEESKYDELKPKPSQPQNNVRSQSAPRDDVHVETGWVPAIPQETLQNADHPILQQIMMIKNYIKQARSENRMDEVVTLRKNLRELEEEFWRQTQKNPFESC